MTIDDCLKINKSRKSNHECSDLMSITKTGVGAILGVSMIGAVASTLKNVFK
jgi:hypothetical protein